MKMAVMVDKDLPTDHSFIEGVISRNLPELGCEVNFIGFSGEKEQNLKEKNNLKFILVKRKGRNFFFEKFQKLNSFSKQLNSLGEIDLLFTRNDPIYLVIGWLYKRKNPNMKHFHQISHLHAYRLIENRYFLKPKIFPKVIGDLALRRIFINKVDKVLAISDGMKEFIKKKFPATHDKIEVFPLGIETSEFQRDFLPFSQRKFDVIYIGTLSKTRRIDIIVDAIKLYKEKYGDICLQIWGSSTNERDNQELEKYINSSGLGESVKLNGRVSRREVLDHLKNARIGLSTIPPEGLLKDISPTKLMEYLASGCFVIASKGIKEQENIIQDSESGVLIDFKVESIAEAIYSALNTIKNSEESARKGREYILKNRNYKNMTKRIVDLLEKND